MSGHRWEEVTGASKIFLEQLSKQKSKGHKVSCVIFNSKSRVAFENETPSVKFMKQITQKYGGLDFAPAIKMARELALRNLKKF